MTLFKKTKAWLRRTFPVPMKIRVYVLESSDSRMKGCLGWFIADGDDKAVIYISRGPDQTMSETLIEEWAHALRHATPLKVDYEGEAHDEHFWVTYGRITNAWRKRLY
jgi:hypothetical protein